MIRLFDTAKLHYNKEQDGLSLPWQGRVFLNPPYENKLASRFMERLKQHNNGVALIYARTDVAYFHEHVFQGADSILFLRGRPRFWKPDGTQGTRSTAASCLIAYGAYNTAALRESGLKGKMVMLHNY